MNQNSNTDLPQSELTRELHDYFPQLSAQEIAGFEAHLHERNIAEERNGYRLNFVGREYARLQAGLPSELLISPDAEHNALPENAQSGNVFITGDNLDALRHLQNAYSGKVKMIYIDPPYNTGKEFVYCDKFEFTDEKLKAALGYGDDEIARLKSIQGKSSHSAWLTFMSPRLALAKKLLADDGVIFVSIDDNEQANLKLLMDDIFGEGNFLTSFIWKKTENIKMDSRFVSTNKDYILCYRKSDCLTDFNKEQSDESRFNLNDEKGKYYLRKLDSLSSSYSKSMDYVIEHGGKKYYAGGSFEKWQERQKTGGNKRDAIWLWSKQKYDEGLSRSEIIFKNGNVYNKVRFTGEASKPYTDFVEADSGQRSQIKLNELFDSRRVFDHPKPINLVTWLIRLVPDENKNAIILDFFAGSGTTAHAVMQLNAEDGGSRKWIMVQLDEPTSPESEAQKAGYSTIDQISRKRIRCAGERIKAEKAPDLFDGNGSVTLDTGFKHHRLVAPQAPTLDKIETFDPNLGGFEDMITPMGGRETILTTWLIKDGHPFDTQVEEVVFDGYTAHYVGASQTLYMIDRGMTTSALKAMLNRIGRGELVVATIVVYPYSFEFERMRELEIGVKIVDDLKLRKRY
jgi:adenine-specific DNA-methyltransferase